MLWPCSSEIDDGLSLARQYAGRGSITEFTVGFYANCVTYYVPISCSHGKLGRFTSTEERLGWVR